MSCVAFVPARSGSKRLPNKNILPLCDKPLVIWTLEACINCSDVDEVIFSTDSIEYWDIAKNYFNSPKLVLDDRSSEEAGDKVKIFDYLKESREKIFGDRAGKFLMALPTMPLRNSNHVSEALKLGELTGRGVFSAVEYDFSTSFAFTVKEAGGWHPVFSDSPMITGNTRSQDQVPTYHPNGAIYIRNIADLSDEGLTSLYHGAEPYIMERLSSVDIDTVEDFKLAELIMLGMADS